MNREFLEGLGLEKEAIDKVMTEHGKSLKSVKEKADKVEGLESQVEDYKTQLTDRDTQLEELKKVDAEALQQTITDLQSTNETQKTEYKTNLETQQKDFAVVNYLREQKVKDPDLLKGKFDLNVVTLKDGKLTGIEEQLKPYKESHDYLFESEEKPNSPTIVAPGNPNGGTGTPNPFSKDSWNLTEQGKLYKENPELYKNLKAQTGK